MAIPHYPYMILKMLGPQGIITIRADFQGATECFWGAIQTTLTAGPLVALPTHADDKPGDGNFTIPSNEAPVVTSMWLTEETKKIKMGFSDECKTQVMVDFVSEWTEH
jgi:hypothetical protein